MSCFIVDLRVVVSTVPGVVVDVVLPDRNFPLASSDCGRSSVSVLKVSLPVLCAVTVSSTVSVYPIFMSDRSLAS